jgi:hypothetical protein
MKTVPISVDAKAPVAGALIVKGIWTKRCAPLRRKVITGTVATNSVFSRWDDKWASGKNIFQRKFLKGNTPWANGLFPARRAAYYATRTFGIFGDSDGDVGKKFGRTGRPIFASARAEVGLIDARPSTPFSH